MRLDDIKRDLNDAQDRAIEVARDLGTVTTFLWSMTNDLEFLANGQHEVSGGEVRDYVEHLQFIARLFEEQRAQVNKLADLVSSARDGVGPLVLAPRPDIAAAD